MNRKLYQYDCLQQSLVHPVEWPSSITKTSWHFDGAATMDIPFFDIMKRLNPDVNFRKADASCAAEVKTFMRPAHVYENEKRIKREFTIMEELWAMRTDDATTKNRIAAIIAENNAERDAQLDITDTFIVLNGTNGSSANEGDNIIDEIDGDDILGEDS